MKPQSPAADAWTRSNPPLLRFLNTCLNEFSAETSGTVADYIPELGKADPAHFGISLATLDGHVYEVGDSRVPFTIQSMSKPFVFALALDMLGATKVESAIGVEPSGDPFNSIRLNADNHPFNPMVNAGAIACTGLIHGSKGDAAFEEIRKALGRFAGRELDVDEAVYTSESQTGDRNRAIAYLLKTNSVIADNVAAVLDVYFRQCAVLVTARDIAVMAATLANRGINPVTGEQVMTPYAISRTLSVMTSSGMYDYAGEWIYRIGIPAKSGVGGGILAALPARLGLGSYSPKLDKHGNSVRGIKVCEALSSHYDLHMLNRSDDARNAVIADYDIGKSPSRRVRRPQEREIIAAHDQDVRIIELVGTLSLSAVDYVSRRLAARPRPQFVIFDLHRVTSTTRAGARLIAEAFAELAALNITVVISGVKRASREWDSLREWTAELRNVRDFYLLDTAIEWVEDQIVYRYGGSIDFHETTELAEQPLLAGLTDEELTDLASLCTIRNYQAGEKIVATGDPANSLFFLRSGAVHVTLTDGVRLATLTAGMAFGEMALLESTRSADVLADISATAYEVALGDFERFRKQHPRAGERIMRNLAQLLADRLIVANARVDILTSM
ncbi:glutaminase A [Bradyrhizobium manausense]|uniref:glutaminase A n=1 Tax=Bradyrhizobium TaxID=374 RepID=UPI001BA8D54A|nr:MULTISPECIES: glutaminase A [Bradyrhizobium]MBR0827510.1 glutaminase A [Bradyrhizobium manausense]UVO25999.1 glutaminase A [Bradyrhizobium arachidis]